MSAPLPFSDDVNTDPHAGRRLSYPWPIEIAPGGRAIVSASIIFLSQRQLHIETTGDIAVTERLLVRLTPRPRFLEAPLLLRVVVVQRTVLANLRGYRYALRLVEIRNQDWSRWLACVGQRPAPALSSTPASGANVPTDVDAVIDAFNLDSDL